MKNFTFLILAFFISSSIFAQSIPPKREMRAAWIATVTNLDWPSSTNLTTAQQKHELINLLDELKRDGINTVIFQVRSECDAMYSSALDPWSYWLTGSQGTAPFPYYDPLEFAIDEAHKRGMELHAWFNPYRAERSVGNYPKASNHVSVLHPDWVIQISTFKFLDPGLPMVRNYVTSVIYDIVSRYDVDGIHADDYFYPYPPNQITNQDAATFAAYPRGFTNINDWRRDNVNLLIAQVNDTIQSVKPWIKFGMSPFGIWKNGVPPGIVGLSAYDDIYCDAIAWLHNRSIDYLTPQLYWPFGGGQDYAKLQPWWADSVYANGRHFYPGHAYYRIVNWSNPSEMPNQIRFDRNNPKVQGSVFFRAKNFPENPKGVTDTLKNDLYRYISILPIMSWKDVVAPNPPQNLRFERLANGQGGLHWDLPQIATDGDSASRYVVYRFNYSNIQPGDLENSANILNVEGSRESIPGEPPAPSGPYYFVVTSLDRNYNESLMSNILQVNPPPVPVLALPVNNAINITDTVILKWNYPDLASSYRLQISSVPTFDSLIVFDQTNITDTVKVITGLEGQTKYYWRVNSTNAGGTSAFSNSFNFTTGFPVTPQLAYPINNTGNIPVDTTFYWHPSLTAVTYDFMLARGADFATNTIVANVQGLVDTTYSVTGLQLNTFHFWKVRARNSFGASNWSTVWRFKTFNPLSIDDDQILPDEYVLEQNYPNPFNPSTNFRFKIAEAGQTTLKIYNLLGQQVAVVLDEFMSPGTYEIRFDANQLSSGIYFYRLRVNNFSASKKMILVR
ncbi:MAG TPA: family 10 glycosylhydrolase [Ignavibacteriaceae bacterium]